MYQIVCITDGNEHVLMDMRDEDYTVESPVLTLELNGTGSLSFTIHPDHPEFDCIKTIISIVKVYKLTGSEKKWCFSGRVMTMDNDIKNSGRIDCEGVMAFLCDSIVRPYEYKGTPEDYVMHLINSHNNQVNEEKRFILGVLDLADVDSNNYIVRANSNYPNTLSEINDKVVKLLDAYISIREESGSTYFDCRQTIDHINTQHIRFGENIIDINRTITAEEVRTVMIGRGAADQEGNKPSVIVENRDAIAKYGRIEGCIEFENVSTITQLELKTAAYLDSVLGIKRTVEVKAVDLNMTDLDIEEISLGYAYVTSKQNDIDNELMLISKMQMHLMEPENSVFTLGASRSTMSASFVHTSAEIDSKIQQVAKSASQEIEYKVSNATQLITGVNGGYIILDCGDDAKSQPSQILIMDTPDKETATNVIRINKNGIGFSTTGYDGPYRNAWTIDGNLVADFVTTGTMFADRIRGGTLLVGGSGSGRDGQIVVRDNSDNVIAIIDINGVDIRKGSIKGAVLEVGGYNNQSGSIVIKNAKGMPMINIDNNGLDVNNGAFNVDMKGNVNCGNITAFGIHGDAVKQFSQNVDNSEAMSIAKQNISTAQSAADNAGNAAASAQQLARELQAHVHNINEGVDKQNGWIRQLSNQLQELGKPGIS